MRKLLLVIDDFNDLLALEAFFRRIGFDVLSLGKDNLVGDALLGFVPDFVIATAEGRSVDGGKLALRLAKQSPPPKLALIYPAGFLPQLPHESRLLIDILIEIPFQPKALLTLIGKLLEIDPTALVSKFQKQRSAKLQSMDDRQLFIDENGVKSGIRIVKGAAQSAEGIEELSGVFIQENNENRISDSRKLRAAAITEDSVDTSKINRVSREDRYKEFLDKNPDDVSGTLSHTALSKAANKLKASSSQDQTKAEMLDLQKREFVKALFKSEKD